MALRLAILTISDAGSRGERSDSSGDLIASWAKERGYVVAERALIPDETARIASQLAAWRSSTCSGSSSSVKLPRPGNLRPWC
jgi:molybdopterin biosynthesis enzyme MoaB